MTAANKTPSGPCSDTCPTGNPGPGGEIDAARERLRLAGSAWMANDTPETHTELLAAKRALHELQPPVPLPPPKPRKRRKRIDMNAREVAAMIARAEALLGADGDEG